MAPQLPLPRTSSQPREERYVRATMTSPITTPVTTEAIGADNGGSVSALRSLAGLPGRLRGSSRARLVPARAPRWRRRLRLDRRLRDRLTTVSAGGSSAASPFFLRRRRLSFGSSSLDSSPSPGFVVSGSSAMPRVCHGAGTPDRLPGTRGAGRNHRAPGQQDADRELVWWVGLTGFEPAASSSRTRRATKLRHSPNAFGSLPEPVEWFDQRPAAPSAHRRERGERRLGAAAEAHLGVRRGPRAGGDVEPRRSRVAGSGVGRVPVQPLRPCGCRGRSW